MKHVICILATCLGFLSCPVLIHSADTTSERTIFVSKHDGTKHCESYSGVSVESMEHELESAGIKVYSSRKGYDGSEGIAICGAPTGQINIYEILSSDLTSAVNMGFKKLP